MGISTGRQGNGPVEPQAGGRRQGETLGRGGGVGTGASVGSGVGSGPSVGKGNVGSGVVGAGSNDGGEATGLTSVDVAAVAVAVDPGLSGDGDVDVAGAVGLDDPLGPCVCDGRASSIIGRLMDAALVTNRIPASPTSARMTS